MKPLANTDIKNNLRIHPTSSIYATNAVSWKQTSLQQKEQSSIKQWTSKLIVNFLVAVVNTLNTQTHSCKEMAEFCFENAQVESISYCKQRMQIKLSLSSDGVETRLCKSNTIFRHTVTHLHSSCGMVWYRTLRVEKGMVKARETWIEERCKEIDDNYGKNNSKKAYGWWKIWPLQRKVVPPTYRIKMGSASQKTRIFTIDGQNTVLNGTITKLKGTPKYWNTHQWPTLTTIPFFGKK